jgi:hypothetical protein
MQVPLQIIFEHIGHSDALEAAVRNEAQRLERFYDRITSARVVIARPSIAITRATPIACASTSPCLGANMLTSRAIRR